MPAIPLDVLECSIYLYPSEAAARAGERAGGSGFLVAVPLDGHDVASLYAVTNTHVIGGGATTIRLNNVDDGVEVIETRDEDWIRHPSGDDLSIAPITLSTDRVKYKAISTATFIKADDASQFLVGQEIYLVGRFIDHEGRQRNIPTARFGHIAQLPYERVRTSRGIEQEAFLADVRSLAGFSGSPVFVYRGRPELDTDHGSWLRSFEHRFLGIDFGHLPARAPVLDPSGRPAEPPLLASQNSGIAAVIPAWCLEELLDDEDVARQRLEAERKWLEANT